MIVENRIENLGKFKIIFWDSDVSAINIDQYKIYIIERILELGDIQEVKWMFDHFSNETIKEALIFGNCYLEEIIYSETLDANSRNNLLILKKGVNIAALDDLIGMKIEAISSRGKKRDFIDLLSMMKYKNISITDAMLLYKEKYKNFNPSIIHALKSLTYFNDAENDPLPEMKTPIQWQEVKSFFERELSKMDNILKLVDKNSGPLKIGIL